MSFEFIKKQENLTNRFYSASVKNPDPLKSIADKFFTAIFIFLSYFLSASLLPQNAFANEESKSSEFTSRLSISSPYSMHGIQDTLPEPAHPDSIPYSARSSLGSKMLGLPATIFHTAVLPLKWGIIYFEEKEVLTKITDFLLNEEGTAGFYPSFSVGGRTDFAGGITYFNRDIFSRGHSLDLNTFYTNRDNFKLGLNYKVPLSENRRNQFILNANFRKNDDQDVFLGGNRSDNELEAEFAIERYDVRAEFGYLLRPDLIASVSSGYKHTDVSDLDPFTETGVPVTDFIDPEKFGTGTVNLVNAGLSATFDRRIAGGQSTRENLVSNLTSSYDFIKSKIRVHSGFLLDGGLVYNRSTDSSDFEFFNYFGEGQFFLRLPGLSQNHRLAFRTRLEKRFAAGDADVPFYEQSFLGDAMNLRGFEQDRFRDLGSLLLTLEYRYPIWDTWDAVVFTDQGQVFSDFRQLGFDRFNGAVGTGLRFMTANDFLFRIEIAFSKEETQTLLEFSMNF